MPSPRTSQQQFETLVNFVEKYPTLLLGNEKKGDAKILWEELTNLLNEDASGPQKSVERWRRTFRDWKSYVTVKAAKMCNAKKMGDDLKHSENLTPVEKKLFDLLRAHKSSDKHKAFGSTLAVKGASSEPNGRLYYSVIKRDNNDDDDDDDVERFSDGSNNTVDVDSSPTRPKISKTSKKVPQEKKVTKVKQEKNSESKVAESEKSKIVSQGKRNMKDSQEKSLQLRVAEAEEKKADALVRMADALSQAADAFKKIASAVELFCTDAKS